MYQKRTNLNVNTKKSRTKLLYEKASYKMLLLKLTTGLQFKMNAACHTILLLKSNFFAQIHSFFEKNQKYILGWFHFLFFSFFGLCEKGKMGQEGKFVFDCIYYFSGFFFAIK